MTDGMITVFGCEKDGRSLFERYAARMGAEVFCVEDPLGSANALDIPLDSTISVNHKASVDVRLIRALQRRGVKYLSSRIIGLDHIDSDAAKMAEAK